MTQPIQSTTGASARLSGWILAAFLGAGLASCIGLLVSGRVEIQSADLSGDDLLHGEITHRFAKQLSKAWFPEQAASLERGASWLLLHDTGARVRTGCAGWLFLTDELKVQPQADKRAMIKLQAVLDVRQRLKQQGIDLLVVVVPDKSRIAATALCGLVRPTALEERVTTWTHNLAQHNVSVLDLASVLRPLGTQAYLRTDTHWSEAGAATAAKAIATQIRHMGIDATPHKALQITSQEIKPRPGDLVRLAGIDWLPLQWQPTLEQATHSEIVSAGNSFSNETKQDDGLDDLLGDTALPNVALIGTSFSRNSNLQGFLELALGAPVGNFAKDGGEFSGSANQYFANQAFRQTPPKLLIWEIPERDLQTLYQPIEWVKK